MEIVVAIAGDNVRCNVVEIRERPAVDLEQFVVGDRVGTRVKAVEITESVTKRISHLAIGVDDARKDLVRAANVLSVIDGRGPQPQNVGTRFVDDLLRRGDVAERLALLAALAVDDPAVRDDLFVRRRVMSSDAAAQAGVEPAAILIAAFEINIGRESQRFAARLENRDTARTRIEPDVEDVGLFAKIGAVAFWTRESVGQQLGLRPSVPRVGRFFGKDVGNVIDDLRVGDRLVASLAIKYRDRHAPKPLARNAPVRPSLEHIRHSALAPCGMPFYFFDLFQRPLTEAFGVRAAGDLIHRNEPLRRRTKDDGIFAPPAMRIAMLVIFGVTAAFRFRAETRRS